jgi:hypothetical protein
MLNMGEMADVLGLTGSGDKKLLMGTNGLGVNASQAGLGATTSSNKSVTTAAAAAGRAVVVVVLLPRKIEEDDM